MNKLIVGLSASLRHAAVIACAGLLATAPAQAVSYFQNLSFLTSVDINNGVIGYQFATGGGRVNSFFVPASGEGPSTITDPFVKTEPALQIYFLGVSSEPVAQDAFTAQLILADPVKHLVLAANTLYSAGLIGQEFTSVFAGFNEAELIDALDILGDGGLAEGDPGYQAQIEAASTRLFQSQDVLFAGNAGFGSEDVFSLTSFSLGTPAGSGFASIDVVAVPEPATWATMLLGFGLVGGVVRRRRHAAAAA